MELIEKSMDVSIIIVNYNTSNLINNCLDALFKLTHGIKFEVIIVDNATEDLAQVIKYATLPNIKLVQLSENIGFGQANNEGSKVAVGKYLFFLNPDTLLMNNAVKILFDFLDTHPKCGACGGNLFDARQKPTMSFKRFSPGIRWEMNELFHLMPEKILFGRNRNFNYLEKPLKVPYICGADLMILKELFQTLEGFSSDFFMYFEETDLCCRLYQLGFSVFSVPDAKILHLEGGSFDDSIKPAKIKMLEDSRKTFYRRNKTVLNRKISDLIYKAFLKSRIKLSNNSKKGYYRQRYLNFMEN